MNYSKRFLLHHWRINNDDALLKSWNVIRSLTVIANWRVLERDHLEVHWSYFHRELWNMRNSYASALVLYIQNIYIQKSTICTKLKRLTEIRGTSNRGTHQKPPFESDYCWDRYERNENVKKKKKKNKRIMMKKIWNEF